MDRKAFWHILKTRFGYQSPEIRRFPVEKIPGGATAGYYARLIRIISGHSILADRGRYSRETWADGSVDIIRSVESVGGRLHVSGLADVAAHTGPLVFIANHMSMIDAFFLPGITLAFNDVSFVVKQALLDYPVFGNIMRAVNPIAVSRKNPREDLRKVLAEGRALLAKGCSVIVFPQATRSHSFDAAHFNSLGIKLAKKANVPVAPVALKTDFQGNGTFLKDFGPVFPRKTIRIRFGEVLAVDGRGQKTHERVVGFIAGHMRKWGVNVQNV
ncbi:1-acyl-sn-glycerol-3-phosphate acyltransferase [Desulfonema ishimotonii]|uniref:1-acyl-sn-glycerol-3-phosphate acyltransferase n=2 Tax=Desulfonema ishimotonii TaxID=45657 RepID=A0A401FXQ2_9BACT|nr:1-acyl-sn-glycerol-3-phosphate acyltransferase [Desulfonema ishimotonii]